MNYKNGYKCLRPLVAKKAGLTACVLAMFLTGTTSVHAAESTQSIYVTAAVYATCSVAFANLDFRGADAGNGVTSGEEIDEETTVVVDCQGNTAINWTLTFGAGSGTGGVSNRTVEHETVTTATLPYNIYSDAARSTVLGDTNLGAGESLTGSGNDSMTVYGRLTAPTSNQLAVGTYNDTILMTLTF